MSRASRVHASAPRSAKAGSKAGRKAHVRGTESSMTSVPWLTDGLGTRLAGSGLASWSYAPGGWLLYRRQPVLCEVTSGRVSRPMPARMNRPASLSRLVPPAPSCGTSCSGSGSVRASTHVALGMPTASSLPLSFSYHWSEHVCSS